MPKVIRNSHKRRSETHTSEVVEYWKVKLSLANYWIISSALRPAIKELAR
jgi:hypothetical protein